MKKVILDKNDAGEAGAYIENGCLYQYNTLDVDAFKKHVAKIRDTYVPSKGMWHIGSMDRRMIDAIRIENKYPNNQEGWKLAIEKAKQGLMDGKYQDFLVHGY